jgi:hypothetical protein
MIKTKEIFMMIATKIKMMEEFMIWINIKLYLKSLNTKNPNIKLMMDQD